MIIIEIAENSKYSKLAEKTAKMLCKIANKQKHVSAEIVEISDKNERIYYV